MGLPTLKERFADAEIKTLCTGMLLYRRIIQKTYGSLSITFTSIGLGAVTEEMREDLKVSQVFNGVPFPRVNMRFLRTHLAS